MNFQIFSFYLPLLAGISVITFLLSLICIPWLIGRLPRDYFMELAKSERSPTNNLNNLPMQLLRNLLGYILLGAGVAMLFLPGQGILTIIIGLLLISFPGKRWLVLKIISYPGIRKSLDWIRIKRGKKMFYWPESSHVQI